MTTTARTIYPAPRDLPLPGARLTGEQAAAVVRWGAQLIAAGTPLPEHGGTCPRGWTGLAKQTGINPGSLYQIAIGRRRAGPRIIRRIAKWWSRVPGWVSRDQSGTRFCAVLQPAKPTVSADPY